MAADLPSKRRGGPCPELDDDLGRSIRQAEQELGLLVAVAVPGTAHGTLRGGGCPASRAGAHGRKGRARESKAAKTGENVFTMVRKIGQKRCARCGLHRPAGALVGSKVVFFAKHTSM
jgi:hypothetical protein